MKLPNRVMFNGQTFIRPDQTSYRTWSRPARDRKSRDQEGYGRRSIAREGVQRAYVENEHYWHNGEGWSFCTSRVCFDSGTASVETGGSDCDGRVSNSTDYEFINAKWAEVGSEAYDQFAQAAGY